MASECEEHHSLQEFKDSFELLAENAREYAIFLLDPDGHMICWNPGATRLFGYESNESVGRHFSQFFCEEDIGSGRPEHELAKRDRRDGPIARAGSFAKTGRGFGATARRRPCSTRTSTSGRLPE